MSSCKKYAHKPDFLGFGLGLRPEHYETILNERPALDWLEILTENYLVPGGKPLYYLDAIRAIYPIVMHGVSLSIGSTAPLNWDYLKHVKELADRVKPQWISDHLCWTGIDGLNLHDLLPLPYTEEAIAHTVARIVQVQDYLDRQILIENVSTYLSYEQSEMPEWTFLVEIAKRADCFILLDVNNVYVSSVNHEFNPNDYLDALPKERLLQIHLAGHSDHGDYIIDTHSAPIPPSVWQLYAETLKRFGKISTLIERDEAIPPLADLMQELDRARGIMATATQIEAIV